MGLVSNIDEINKLLEKGVKTRKFVGYTNWTELINNLSQDTGNKIVQMSTGQVVEIVKYHDKATEGDTAGETNYGLVAVNVNETTFKTGEKVIDGVGEEITLTKDTAGIVISGTSDISKVGNLGTYTPCEAGFLYVSKETFVTSVVAICGYAIEDDVAKQLVTDLDALPIDWGPDLLKADEIGTEEDKILCKIEKGGNTYFNKKAQDNVYNGLVQLGFFDEGGKIFNPEALENGKTYTFNNLVSVKELAQQQVNNIKATVDVDGLVGVAGFNSALFNALDNLVNNIDETNFSGLGIVTFNIILYKIDGNSGTEIGLYVAPNIARTNQTQGIYEETDNSSNPEHNYKSFNFGNGYDLTDASLRESKNQSYGYYGKIYGYSSESYKLNVNVYNWFKTYNTDGTTLSAYYFDIVKFSDKFEIWQQLYSYESFNVGTFSQEEEKYKKRKLPNAKTPDVTKPLSENYPEWYNNTKEQSTPTEKNKNKKKKYRYIGGIINTNLDPENKNLNDQDKAQKGENDDKNLQDKWPSIKEIIDNIINPPTDPSDPKPKPEGENPKPFVPANPVSESGFVSLYSPSLSELKAFSSWLWSTDFSNSIKKLFQDPMNAIIGLHMIYTEPEIGARKNIVVGYVDSNVNTRTVANQYKKIDCGSIAVREYYGDSRDYDFTKISIYLPFLGIQQLNAKDLIGGSINVTATVDVLTGTIRYNLNITKHGVTQTLYTFSGNCAVQLPISSGSYASILANTIGLVAGGVATFATGGAAAPVLIGAAAQAVTGTRANVAVSNTIGSNAGAMGIKKPYLILNRQNSYNATAYNNIQGYPSNINVKLSNCSGFTRVKECHLDGIPATDEELEEIYTLLKQGVIL